MIVFPEGFCGSDQRSSILFVDTVEVSILLTTGLVVWEKAQIPMKSMQMRKICLKSCVFFIFYIIEQNLRFDKMQCFNYSIDMFVSIIIDPGSIDSAKSMVELLTNSGFKKVQRSCWENPKISEAELSEIKKDIDRVTDYYDVVRIYQFPLKGMFVITELKEKKWRRCQLSAAQTPQKGPARTAGR